MQTGSNGRILRGLATLVACTFVLVAIAIPENRLTEADVARPSLDKSLADPPNSQQQAAAPAKLAKASDYAFLLPSPDDSYPARWCAGTTIDYTIDFSQARAAGLDATRELNRWRDVFDEWSRASNGAYAFRFAGETSLGTIGSPGDREIDIDAIAPQTIGVTYVYGSPSDAGGNRDYLASSVAGQTTGNGGIQVVSRGTDDAAALVGERGFVMIDAVDVLALAPNGLRRTLYRHEVGHSLGLGHVSRPNSLMHGTLSQERLNLTHGDVAGIQALAAMPCRAD